ncbi:MAG TPA: hypothetical protein PKD64_03010 [Pirellulaceae bacterium]|nr:hypothetical protein [Pirellulaceae bacterium]HMO91139.1 hypothetical protein [Pirellulaceae bacterium]HMP69090.1 hypothetical protein [Pirellulaceae bacterium]
MNENPGQRRLIDDFIPQFDVRERHEILVRAPASVVMQIARTFDMQSILPVRIIFWLRAKLMRSQAPGAAPQGLVNDTLGMGWGVLYDDPQRQFIAGAACQPWLADVVFTPIPVHRFADFAEPNFVKIVWTLETDEQGAELTRFATETRVKATDEQAKKKFRRYWRVYGIGILMIRWMLLPAVRRQAVRQWKKDKNKNNNSSKLDRNSLK